MRVSKILIEEEIISKERAKPKDIFKDLLSLRLVWSTMKHQSNQLGWFFSKKVSVETAVKHFAMVKYTVAEA